MTSAQADTGLFEAILMLGKMIGMSRSVATVFAILYSVDSPLTVEEVVEQSGLSKSAVSLALRELVHIGAAHEQVVVGERSRRYGAMPDLVQVTTEIVMTRLNYPLSELRDKLSQSGGSDARYDQVLSLVDTIDKTLADIQEQYQ